MGKLAVLRAVVDVRRSPTVGACSVCGHVTAFVWVDGNPRDGLACPFCWGTARHRLVAKVLLEQFGGRRALSRLRQLEKSVYVADRHGPLMRGLRHVRDQVTTSDFVPDVALGVPLPGGGTCQDLEDLTYDDETFDIVVTEDVLEHVRHPDTAFAEIRRVLRPGGLHVFTVPFALDRPTLTRVDTSGDEDVHLLEPEWHGDSIRGRILAYRTFGYDLFASLEALGFVTTLRQASFADRRQGIFNVNVFISTRITADGPV